LLPFFAVLIVSLHRTSSVENEAVFHLTVESPCILKFCCMVPGSWLELGDLHVLCYTEKHRCSWRLMGLELIRAEGHGRPNREIYALSREWHHSFPLNNRSGLCLREAK
jgi:hypothetical protein